MGRFTKILLYALFLIVFAACHHGVSHRDIAAIDELEAGWGVKVLAIRLSANGYLLDFRYKVIDAEKAAPLFSREIKPYLLDQASGAVFGVPSSPKVGSLRQTRPPVAGKNYFIMFANPANYVKKGSKVSVVIGDLKIENLTVE